MADSRSLGDYDVIKMIGQGPLGSLYLAEHRFMKKQFCLKILPQELAQDRGFIQRFEEEIAKLSSLNHPNIVKIHNISFASGRYFLVTDCVVDDVGETTNLAQYMISLDEHLKEEDLFCLLQDVAEALDYAHNQCEDFVHRELKLNNILVSKKEGKPKFYLSDFGLAKIVGDGAILTRTFKSVAEALSIYQEINPASESEALYPSPEIDETKLSPLHASFLQNFSFLAPEQKKLNEFHEIGPKADTYAFGVLAYYLLTSRFPEGYFEMPSVLGTPYQWNWDFLVKECLHFDPEKRPLELVPILKGVKSVKKEIASPQAFFVKQEDSHEAYPMEEAAHVSLKEPAFISEEQESQHFKPVFNEAYLERPVHDPDPAKQFAIDHGVKHYEPVRKEIHKIEPLLTEMTIIKATNFMRGSNEGSRDEMPRHNISVESFAMDVHPVTNEQFVRFLEALGGEKDSNHNDVIRLKESRIKRSGGRYTIESGYGKHPVVGVTWYGALAYAKWVGKRLPTEAEWELAAKGGEEDAIYPTGSSIEKSEANFFSSDTTPVKSYPPNPFGLFDMAGNVYEWCQDWYGYNYYEVSIQEPDDPKGPLQGVYRVLRGGCWKSLKEDLRCSKRHRNNPGTVNSTYGFRCAVDVKKEY